MIELIDQDIQPNIDRSSAGALLKLDAALEMEININEAFAAIEAYILVALWGAVFTGGVVAIALLILRRKGRKDAIPFGPFMSLGGIVVLLAGTEIVSSYQRLVDAIAGV